MDCTNLFAQLSVAADGRQGFFIDSEVIEAGCKTVIGTRCKEFGMSYAKPGTENTLYGTIDHAWHQSLPPRETALVR